MEPIATTYALKYHCMSCERSKNNVKHTRSLVEVVDNVKLTDISETAVRNTARSQNPDFAQKHLRWKDYKHLSLAATSEIRVRLYYPIARSIF